LALLDNSKDILPLSAVAELLGAKSRTLKMYEDRLLLPKKDSIKKKLYSIDDIKQIAFVHYLASVKKINANGIFYILDMIAENMDEETQNSFFEKVEDKMSKISSLDIQDTDSI
jgi:MerR family transcriptional regulator, heat shock protein HspR